MTQEQEVDMEGWLTRLCVKNGVNDVQLLKQTEEFKKHYAAVQAKAPKLSAESLTVKALEAMSFIEKTDQTINAHVIRCPAIGYRYDEASNQNVADEVGVRIVTPAGRPLFVKYRDYDPLLTMEDNIARTPLPPLASGKPCHIQGARTAEDLRTGELTVALPKDAKVIPGGHSDPFPDGLDLGHVLGKKARERGWGAWSRDKTRGTIRGKFGDRAGSATVFVGTTGDASENKVRDYADDPNDPKDPHVLQAIVYDRRHLCVSAKLPLAEVRSQLGLPPGASKEAVLASSANQRILLCGFGNMFASVSATDLFKEQAQAVLQDLANRHLLVPTGKRNLRRLNLKALPQVRDPATGKEIPTDYVPIGNMNVYDVEEKADGTWEFSVLAESIGRKPWFTLKQSDEKDGDGNVKGKRNAESFFLFLDAVDEVPESNPMLQVVRQLKLTA